MRIGELAKRLGLNPKTLRYWEEIGLLPPPSRNSSGYRVYTEEHLKLCEFILKAKAVGFKLEDIKEIISLKFSGRTPCGCVEEKIKGKIREIENLIEELNSQKKLLEGLLRKRRDVPASVCPIIESIR
ncbi:DNA-binding transcriptional MerR regulator [Hydrogenivirga caldilitoris]|uniref:DNA-binding transcriptional MerR regulator n=1 Tax=Hydrogenivirga caldilitoris TaxID=246264 RepID=A0A497XQR6_9AQUI|nr:heavy metal-responsive transcriptional regulator [Hydrogenivirga caldilitoris]RLJ71326.1 DNA-binding transcriptional MerR regulator [Hydrogenivirga caldilitoris]